MSPLKHNDFVIGVASDRGQRRKRNEDAYGHPRQSDRDRAGERGYIYAPNAEAGLYLVADGVGSSEEGQIASAKAVRTVIEAYYRAASTSTTEREDFQLERALQEANQALCTFSTQAGVTASTTLVALLYTHARVLIANVGDSRAYRLHENTIELLTQDHSMRAELLQSGAVSQEESLQIPDNWITRSLGRGTELIPDIFEVEFAAQDRFVLCTDGLTRHVHEAEILDTIKQHKDPQRAAQALVELANQRGGKDNITVMILQPRSLRQRSNLSLPQIAQAIALLGLLTTLFWVLIKTPVFERDSDILATPSSSPTAPLPSTSPLQSPPSLPTLDE